MTIDWNCSVARKGPSDYMSDVMIYLEGMFSLLHLLPPEMRSVFLHAIHSHLNLKMMLQLCDESVTVISKASIENLKFDLSQLLDKTNAQLSKDFEGHLDCYKPLQELIELLLTENFASIKQFQSLCMFSRSHSMDGFSLRTVLERYRGSVSSATRSTIDLILTKEMDM